MDVLSFLLWILIGALAGWIAGELMRGRGFGLLGNIIVGIVGALIGGLIFGALGVGPGFGLLGSLITAVIGAVVLLFIISLVRRPTV
ncbi:MAG TPA: GlsB/YeaQ/YmgE family stress response membrane protein [Anaerolineae bacterium]|nr:GlsB/YeaQ/YmgE family stress response membrane protein [Anaerolineae bacterium]HMR63630.1 GlsB/YeaQ/YmgE family stress response membrane protein [Anaerolineae bacterium]